jgi:hypothetical protein
MSYIIIIVITIIIVIITIIIVIIYVNIIIITTNDLCSATCLDLCMSRSSYCKTKWSFWLDSVLAWCCCWCAKCVLYYVSCSEGVFLGLCFAFSFVWLLCCQLGYWWWCGCGLGVGSMYWGYRFLCFRLLWGATGPVCCVLCHVYCYTAYTRHITNSITTVQSATKNLITYYSNLNMTYRGLNMLH